MSTILTRDVDGIVGISALERISGRAADDRFLIAPATDGGGRLIFDIDGNGRCVGAVVKAIAPTAAVNGPI